MREFLHLLKVSDVLVVTAVSMDQPFCLLNFAWLDVLVNIDVAFISWNEEVTVVDEDEDVEDLLSKVHDVSKKSNKITSSILSHHFLRLDKASDQLITLKFIAVVFQCKQSRWRYFDRIPVFVIFAVTEPGSQLVPLSNLNHVCIACGRLVHDFLFELLI